MRAQIYVDNLDPLTTDVELRRLFSPYGIVRSARIVVHSDTQRSTGVGFVEMASDEDAEAAIAMVSGRGYHGQKLLVCWTHPRPESQARDGHDYGSMNMPEPNPPVVPRGPLPGGYGDRSGGGSRGHQFFIPGQTGRATKKAEPLVSWGPFAPAWTSGIPGGGVLRASGRLD